MVKCFGVGGGGVGGLMVGFGAFGKMSLKNREGCAILNEYCAALIFYFLILNFQIIY